MLTANKTGSVVTYHEGLQLIKTNDPYYISTTACYYQQTWQVGDLPWAASTYEVSWLLSQVALRDQVRNQ